MWYVVYNYVTNYNNYVSVVYFWIGSILWLDYKMLSQKALLQLFYDEYEEYHVVSSHDMHTHTHRVLSKLIPGSSLAYQSLQANRESWKELRDKKQ